MSCLPSQNIFILFFIFFIYFFLTIIYQYLNLSRFLHSFPWVLNFNILKHVITHLYKHICERNCLVFMFIFIIFLNIASKYEMMEEWLPSWINVTSTSLQYLFLCSYDMLLQTSCQLHVRFDVHCLADNTKTKLIYLLIADKFSNLASILNFYH